MPLLPPSLRAAPARSSTSGLWSASCLRGLMACMARGRPPLLPSAHLCATQSPGSGARPPRRGARGKDPLTPSTPPGGRAVTLRSVVIAEPVRTAIGAFGGTLKAMPAPDLGAVVIPAAVERAGLKPDDIETVAMG